MLIADHTDGQWPIIGIGGISSASDAYDKISNGACLVQIYSSLVFEGPAVIKQIVNGLDKRMKKRNSKFFRFDWLSEVVIYVNSQNKITLDWGNSQLL